MLAMDTVSIRTWSIKTMSSSFSKDWGSGTLHIGGDGSKHGISQGSPHSSVASSERDNIVDDGSE